MTPRRLIRWKSFWLGVLVLGFLGWAWVRSMQRNDSVRFGLGGDTWEIDRAQGMTSATWWDNNDFGTGRGIHSVSFSSVPGQGFNQDIPPAFDRWAEERVGTFVLKPSQWWVADWFLMLLFFLSGSAFLAWRWRRQRKLTETNA